MTTMTTTTTTMMMMMMILKVFLLLSKGDLKRETESEIAVQYQVLE
jgi:hypothetical protein